VGIRGIQIAEPFAEQATPNPDSHNGPPGKKTGRQHDGKQIEKAERKIRFRPPIDDRDCDHDQCGDQQNHAPIPPVPDPVQVKHQLSMAFSCESFTELLRRALRSIEWRWCA